jgi:hypothetical protein
VTVSGSIDLYPGVFSIHLFFYSAPSSFLYFFIFILLSNAALVHVSSPWAPSLDQTRRQYTTIRGLLFLAKIIVCLAKPVC